MGRVVGLVRITLIRYVSTLSKQWEKGIVIKAVSRVWKVRNWGNSVGGEILCS